jgi:chorismate mutase/prephenate dehydrogenase
MARDELARLRAELAQVDRAIAREIGRRLTLAHRIGSAKRAAHRPLRAPDVEREVISRWRRALERAHVPAERAEELARWLVAEAIRVQGNGHRLPPPLRRKILVIGGAGGMGGWLVRYFRRQGHRVRVEDPRTGGGATRPREAARAWADVIVVATPVAAAARVYRQLGHRPRRSLVVDVLSVKAPLLPEIDRLRSAGFRVASAHPLFGPASDPTARLTVLILDCGDAGATKDAAHLFDGGTLAVVVRPIRDHDPLMADLQALPRLASLLFTGALRAGPSSPTELAQLETPSFRRQALAAREVVGEAEALSFAILAANPSVASTLARLDAALRTLRRALAHRSSAGHRRLLHAGIRVLSPVLPAEGGLLRQRRRRRSVPRAARP